MVTTLLFHERFIAHTLKDTKEFVVPTEVESRFLSQGFKMKEGSKIASFFAGKSVFITGATGFVGKATVAKLLRACPEIGHVYILLRPKGKSTVDERVRALLEQPIFDSLRKSNPAALLKVVPLPGDIGLPNLGLTQETEELLIERIAIVIHSAADVNFHASLKTAVNTNICGTQRLLLLASKFKRIEAFVYVSTAYSNCEFPEVLEEIYPMDVDIKQLVDDAARLPEEALHDVSNRIRGKKPNTYTFTKAVAEHLLTTTNNGGRLPICIVRPSIVTATAHDPFPGWVDNMNGASGLILANGSGMLRTMIGDRSKIADFIPLDYVVNTIIAASWHLAISARSTEKIQVYNCCSGLLNPLTWGAWIQHVQKNMVALPMSNVLWWPSSSFTLNSQLHRVKNILVQYLPAKMIDLARMMSGKKPVMIRTYNVIRKATDVMEPFVTRDWRFRCDNWVSLYHSLCPCDKEIFNMDLTRLNWGNYAEDYWNGLRTHVLHEDDRAAAVGSQRLQRIQWIQRTSVILVILGFSLAPQLLLSQSPRSMY